MQFPCITFLLSKARGTVCHPFPNLWLVSQQLLLLSNLVRGRGHGYPLDANVACGSLGRAKVTRRPPPRERPGPPSYSPDAGHPRGGGRRLARKPGPPGWGWPLTPGPPGEKRVTPPTHPRLGGLPGKAGRVPNRQRPPTPRPPAPAGTHSTAPRLPRAAQTPVQPPRQQRPPASGARVGEAAGRRRAGENYDFQTCAVRQWPADLAGRRQDTQPIR